MSNVRKEAPTTGARQGTQPRAQQAPPEPTGWTGWVVFGAMMMILLGSFQAIAGLVALFQESYFVVPSQDLVVSVNYDTWGWVHLIVGLTALAAGFGLFTGAMWARVLGITVAVLSAIVNFVFIAAYPLWGITLVTLDVLIIYAIAAHGRELKSAEL
jgi:hypothetical protein